MKKYLLVLAVFLLPVSLHAEVKDLCLVVKEMTCAVCASKVEGSLKKVDGVNKCLIDNKTAKGSCSYDEAKTSPEKIIEACNKTGFKCEKCE